MQKVKVKHYNRSATILIVLAMLGVQACDPWDAKSRFPPLVYDEPHSRPVESVGIKEGASTQGLAEDDLISIRIAVARTPGVACSILSIQVFPPPPNAFPAFAIIRVSGYYLYLSKARDNQWHVTRIARYEI